MQSEQQYFENGLPIAEYMEQMTSLKNDSYRVYNSFELPHDPEFYAILETQKPHILAITEDWCGDAMMNNAILRKIIEHTGLEMNCVLRDQNLNLMDRYLTNGGRSIPVYIFLSPAGEVLGKWGPRAPELQQYVMDKKAALPPQEDPAFEEKQKELFISIREENVSNEQFWRFVFEDIRKTVLEIYSEE